AVRKGVRRDQGDQEEQPRVRAIFAELQQESSGGARQATHACDRGTRVSGCCKTRRFGRVRGPLQTVRKHGPSRSTANDAEPRGRRRCSAGVISAGLYSSQELHWLFPFFHVAVAHCHQRCPDETTQKAAS